MVRSLAENYDKMPVQHAGHDAGEEAFVRDFELQAYFQAHQLPETGYSCVKFLPPRDKSDIKSFISASDDGLVKHYEVEDQGPRLKTLLLREDNQDDLQMVAGSEKYVAAVYGSQLTIWSRSKLGE